MKILFITGSHPPGKCGVGDYTAKLAETLAANEELTITVLSDASIDQRTGDTPYKVIASVETWTFRDASRIINAVEKDAPDIVHIQYPTQAYGKNLFPWLIPMLLHWRGFAIVQTWHEYYPSRWRGIVNGWVPGGLIVVRPNYMERTPPWFQRIISNKEIRFIPNASVIPPVKPSAEERRAIRERFDGTDHSLVVYFGFLYPSKGVESIFRICDPENHRIVLICDIDPDIPYHHSILELANGTEWNRKCFTTGFLPALEVANILASADAVMLPFTTGGGSWNTSVHAVCAIGTFLLLTSNEKNGYVPAENIYFARPGDIQEMKRALETYIGLRNENPPADLSSSWDNIANAHIELYHAVQDKRRKAGSDA